MLKILFVVFAIFPALAGFSLQYAIRKTAAPDHIDSVVMTPVFFALAALSAWLGVRWARASPRDLAVLIWSAVLGSWALGIALVVMGFVGAFD